MIKIKTKTPTKPSRNKSSEAYHNGLSIAHTYGTTTITETVLYNSTDVQLFFEKLRLNLSKKDRVSIYYRSPFWEWLIDLKQHFLVTGSKKNTLKNWIDISDLENFLRLSGFEVVETKSRLLGLYIFVVAKPVNQRSLNKISVSIVIPARNEQGNIPKIVNGIPKFGKSQEIIFIEGGSKDKTWNKIIAETKKHKNVKAFKQSGSGKADAVLLGFEKAKGDILMIYDADRTVDSTDLPKFYKVLASGSAEFANGCRLIYPMKKDAMRTLNKIANIFFGFAFSKILKTRFKDTLCGTKAIFRKDFIKYKKDIVNYLASDPFGDFALIFMAIKQKKKIVEIPVHYKERIYGSTNINRFYHGLLLAKMLVRAYFEFKS